MVSLVQVYSSSRPFRPQVLCTSRGDHLLGNLWKGPAGGLAAPAMRPPGRPPAGGRPKKEPPSEAHNGPRLGGSPGLRHHGPGAMPGGDAAGPYYAVGEVSTCRPRICRETTPSLLIWLAGEAAVNSASASAVAA